MCWRIYLLRKIRCGTDWKQGDDLYDLMNTCEGINDTLIPGIVQAHGLCSVGTRMRERLLYTNIAVPFKQLTPKTLIKMSSHDLQQVDI